MKFWSYYFFKEGEEMYLYSHYANRKSEKPKTFLVIVLTAFFTTVILENIMMFAEREQKGLLVQRLSTSEGESLGEYARNAEAENRSMETSQMIEKIKNSTVGISLVKPEGESLLDLHATEKWGMGTGIIVSRNGYILTNEHLAKTVGAKIKVSLSDGTTVPGRVIWNEKNIDLAILKIEKKNLTPVKLGNSDGIYVGDDVIAIGNPMGVEFQGTTTKGIVSGLNRTFTFEENGEKVFMEGLIQTDASINPGNSGGPLVEENGEVVGVNTVKLTDAEGIGFAVPVNIVKPIIERLEQEDEFEEATLGIYAYDKEVIPYMETKADLKKGIYVASIDRYGPCGNTGLKVGDIIVSIDNVDVDKMVELREYLYRKEPGDKVTLKVVDGEEKEITVRLRKKIDMVQ